MAPFFVDKTGCETYNKAPFRAEVLGDVVPQVL